MIRVRDKHGNVVFEFSTENLARRYIENHRGSYIDVNDLRALHKTISPFYQEYLQFTPRLDK